MAKLESSLKNMILSLTSICIVAGALLAGVYMLTKAPIEKAALAKQTAAEQSVLAGQEGTTVIAEADGFGGPIKIMLGFAADGTILGYEVLDCSQETPGLGSKCVDWFKNAEKAGQNIVGRKATGKFIVSKDADDKTDSSDKVDAITAATISSRAFLKAVNEAYAEFASVEAASGATQKAEHECCGEGACEHHCAGACGHHEAEHECAHECNHECNK